MPDARSLPGALFLVTIALVIGTALLSRQRATLREVALLVPVAFVALTAARHTPFLAIAAAPYFASRWPDPLAEWRSTSDSRTSETHWASRIPSLGRDGVPRAVATRPGAPTPGDLGRAVVALAFLGALAFAVGVADAKVDESGYPRASLAALPPGPGTLNQYDWGGYLIAFAPATPVFIDGRLFPYVPAVLDDYRAIIGAHPGWESVAAGRGVTAMLVRPSDAITVRAPERGWRVAYADAIAVVLIK